MTNQTIKWEGLRALAIKTKQTIHKHKHLHLVSVTGQNVTRTENKLWIINEIY
jgi:hypothetical protein